MSRISFALDAMSLAGLVSLDLLSRVMAKHKRAIKATTPELTNICDTHGGIPCSLWMISLNIC